MYDIPDYEDVTPDAPVRAFRFRGETDPHARGGIRATLPSPVMGIIKLQHVPISHNTQLAKYGGSFNSKNLCWYVQPTGSNWTWLIRYLTRERVVMERSVVELLRQVSADLQARDKAA